MTHSAPPVGTTVSWTLHPTAPTRAETREAIRLGRDGWRVEFVGYGGVVLSHPQKTQDGRGLWLHLDQVRGFRSVTGETTRSPS